MPLWDDDPSEPRSAFDPLHYKHRQAEDGAPELGADFVTYLSAAFNETRAQQEENEQMLDAHSGNVWLTVSQIALVLHTNRDIVRRAIHAGDLEAQRLGGRYGHYASLWGIRRLPPVMWLQGGNSCRDRAPFRRTDGRRAGSVCVARSPSRQRPTSLRVGALCSFLALQRSDTFAVTSRSIGLAGSRCLPGSARRAIMP
jgi:excisionase family DNA binding protein